MVCIGEEGLARYLAGDLDYGAHERAEAHISECASCSAMLGELTMRTEVRAVGEEHRGGFLQADTNVKDKVMWLERHYGLQVGDVIADKYKIEKVIGEGGMGIVVRAFHIALREKVALKFMHPSMATNPNHAARFIREARAAVRLREEHVARVLDLGEVDDTGPYIVMEYLEGQDLLAYLKKNAPLPVAESIELIRQACSGVAAAHEAAIVHRDLKPGNMFLTEKRGKQVLKVLDFGVSKYLEGDSLAVTGTNMVVGSPMYMAPELFETARNATPASDVWAIGVIFYRMLTGRLPFFGESLPELVAKIHFGAPTPVTHWRPELPREVCHILDGCFDREPRRRFGDAREMLAAVVQLPAVVRSHQAAPTTRVPPLERTTTPAPRQSGRQAPRGTSGEWVSLPEPQRRARPWLFAVIGAAVASALFGGILVATSAGDRNDRDDPVNPVTEPAEGPASDKTPAAVQAIDAAALDQPDATAAAPTPDAAVVVETDAAPVRTNASDARKRRERLARERRERVRKERERRERERLRKARERKEREKNKEPVLLIPDKDKKKNQ